MKEEEIVQVLVEALEKINSANSNISYASSYSRSSATATYCSHANSSLRGAKKQLEGLISQLSHTEENSEIKSDSLAKTEDQEISQ